MQMDDENMSLMLFEENPVRRIWQDDRWFYSVIDVVAVLTNSGNPGTYWRVLKKRLLDEGSQIVTNCNSLKLPAPDGKMRATDCADMETLLRIIQSIPSPKAEPFKQWQATLGASALETPAEDIKRLEYRGKLTIIHKLLHDTVHHRGIRTPRQHANFENTGKKALYDGETRDAIAARKGIGNDDIYSWMYAEEMADNIFMEAQTNAMITRMDITGEQALNTAHEQVGKEVRETIKRMGGTMPEELPTPKKSLEQIGAEDKRRRTKGDNLFPEIDTPDDSK